MVRVLEVVPVPHDTLQRSQAPQSDTKQSSEGKNKHKRICELIATIADAKTRERNIEEKSDQ